MWNQACDMYSAIAIKTYTNLIKWGDPRIQDTPDRF